MEQMTSMHKKEYRVLFFCSSHSRCFSAPICRVINRLKNKRLLVTSNHVIQYIYNHLAELLNWSLTAKIGVVIHSCDFMYIPCNFSNHSKLNVNCNFEGKCWRKCLIYEAKWKLCDGIYIGNTQKNLKKRMDGHFSNVRFLLKTIKFRIYNQHFKSNTSLTYLYMYMLLNSVNQISTIGEIKTFT